MKSSENCFYFLTCILPDYMAHNFPKEFWKNSHFENMTAVFLLRCLNSLRWEISLIYHWNIDLNSAIFSGGAGGARAPPELGGSHKGQSLISAYQSSAITTNTPGFEKLNTALIHGSKKCLFCMSWSQKMIKISFRCITNHIKLK